MPFRVVYKGNEVGEYFADLVVAERIIVEVKAVSELTKVHQAQCINYLHISGLRLGLLVNFYGLKAVWRRFVV